MKIKKVVHKEIPKKQDALGIAYNDKLLDPPHKVGIIEIEKRQTPLNILDTEIHEYIHMKYPEIPEESVIKMGRGIGRFLWKLGYRKPDK